MDMQISTINYDMPAIPHGGPTQKAARVAEDVESLFIYQLMKAMDETLDHEEDDILYSSAEDTYRSMYNEQLAREIAKGDGIGLKASIERAVNQYQ